MLFNADLKKLNGRYLRSSRQPTRNHEITSLEMPGGGSRLTGPTKYASFVDIVGFVGRARSQPPLGKSEHNIDLPTNSKVLDIKNALAIKQSV